MHLCLREYKQQYVLSPQLNLEFLKQLMRL